MGNIVVGTAGCFVGDLIYLGYLGLRLDTKFEWLGVIVASALGAMLALVLFNRFLILIR